MYQLFIEQVWRDSTWTERFPSQKELVKYFQHVDIKLDLSKDCTFGARVLFWQFSALMSLAL
jgi:hypothetical protein